MARTKQTTRKSFSGHSRAIAPGKPVPSTGKPASMERLLKQRHLDFLAAKKKHLAAEAWRKTVEKKGKPQQVIKAQQRRREQEARARFQRRQRERWAKREAVRKEMEALDQEWKANYWPDENMKGFTTSPSSVSSGETWTPPKTEKTAQGPRRLQPDDAKALQPDQTWYGRDPTEALQLPAFVSRSEIEALCHRYLELYLRGRNMNTDAVSTLIENAVLFEAALRQAMLMQARAIQRSRRLTAQAGEAAQSRMLEEDRQERFHNLFCASRTIKPAQEQKSDNIKGTDALNAIKIT